MLAVTLLRYWWLRPQTVDPLHVEEHDPLKSQTFSSITAPIDGPQPEKPQEWTQIPASVGGDHPAQRSVIEIEKAVSEGKDMILVETEVAGQIYSHYISYGWLMQENTMFYGCIGLFASYFWPKSWIIYAPCTVFSLAHSWVYFRVYKYDRLSQYQAYDDDRHPVSNLITAWVLGQRPDHFKYVLKKEKSIRSEIISESILYASIISTLVSLWKIEEHVVGGRFTTSYQQPTSLSDGLNAPAYLSGYFQPAELVPVAPGLYLPSDIPYVTRWFDLPWFNFRIKRMKFDLAVIICAIGGYFVYKAFEHFFGYSGDGGSPEADELGREWSGNPDSRNEALSKDVNPNPYWVDIQTEDSGNVVLGVSKAPSNTSLDLEIKEQAEITRIVSEEPFGWVKPGYSENHYGIFT